jgi:tetratricopeptide (TPR) repeat protein
LDLTLVLPAIRDLLFVTCSLRNVKSQCAASFRATLKEMKMKHKLSLFKSLPAVAGLLAFALSPAFMQAQNMGKVHGHVTNPTGEAQDKGTVSLTTDGGNTLKFTFPINANGDYTGQATPGTYDAVFRAPDTPPGKIVDTVKNIKITTEGDAVADIDMSRPDYINKLPPDQRKALEELKQKNAAAVQANQAISHANVDLKQVTQDKKDIEGASDAARQQLGASATKGDIQAKVNEIKAAKFADIETLMNNDIKGMPNEALLYTNLGYAQSGEQKYDDATTSYNKAIELEKATPKPRLDVLAVAESGLGEVYARAGKVPEANAAYQESAKDDPTRAAMQLRNEAVIFFQTHNSDAQVAAADEAIKVNPNDPILYYIKGQGLVSNATIDPKTNRIVLPPDCAAAYQKYLDLAPTGQFADEVAGILQQAGQKVSSSYHAPSSKK